MSATLPSVGALRLTSSADAPDHELAALAATGDPRAFEHLYDRYAQRVLNLCERILGSGHDAADATQETFIRMLRRLPGLDLREASFAPYLFTAARHVCFDQMQRGARADVVDEVDEGGAPVGGRDAAPAMEDPERSALIADSQADVRDACARLNPRHREVLYLREVEELSYDDIGRVMDLNANAVAQLISRARLRLRDELRGTALASFARGSEDCTRATTLLSSVVDGKRCGEDDAAWLLEHLAGCDACRLAKESLAEAGRSYRLLAPLVPLEVLRRTTLAKAAEPLAQLREAHERDRGDDDAPGAGGTAGARRFSRRRLAAAGGLVVVLALLVLAAPTHEDPARVVQVREAAAPGVVPAAAPSPGTAARSPRDARDPDRPVSSTPGAPPAAAGPDAPAPAASTPTARRRATTAPRRGTARPGTPGAVGPAVPQGPVTSVPPVGAEPVPQVSDPVAPVPEPPAATTPEPEPAPPDPVVEEPPTRTTPDSTTTPTRPPPPGGSSTGTRDPTGGGGG